MLWNITTLVSITHGGNSFDCEIYTKLMILNLHICTKLGCNEGGKYKDVILGKVVIKLIR